MDILVCIKQVPDTEQIHIDENTNTLIRKGVASILNPFDGYALEMSLRLREQAGGSVTLLSMGPLQAKQVLEGGLAVGADSAYLVSDLKFGGSDTLATAYILAQAVRKLEYKKGSVFDLILCGKQAIDGETAQVGPELAERLGYTQLTGVTEVNSKDSQELLVTRECESSTEVYHLSLPALLTIARPAYDLRFPNIKDKMRAKKVEIPVMSMEDIDAQVNLIGLQGSQTQVRKTFVPGLKKGSAKAFQGTSEELAKQLMRILEKEGYLQ